MFSPKVLDRANVIEFRVTEEQAQAFLTSGSSGLMTVETAPEGYAEAFLRLCRDARETPLVNLALARERSQNVQAQIEECHKVLRNLFVILRIHRQEFAYRTISEVLRYVYLDFALSEHEDSWRWNASIDAQILQKVLPKLHGSKRRIGSLLTALAKYCERGDVEEATRFARDENNADTFNANEGSRFPTPQFPISYEKLCEMIVAVRRDQFVSFIQ
jgi:5-methylcytosine-specific restriction enzyme B